MVFADAAAAVAVSASFATLSALAAVAFALVAAVVEWERGLCWSCGYVTWESVASSAEASRCHRLPID